MAGGMGARARDLFAERNIRVVVGARSDSPEEIVNLFLRRSLQTGGNACTHTDGDACGG